MSEKTPQEIGAEAAAGFAIAQAIERLATAVEHLGIWGPAPTALAPMPSVASAVFDVPPTMLHDLPPDELAPIPGAFPPDPRAAQPPVTAGAPQFVPPNPPQNTAPSGWFAGAVHTPGHKPLKANSKGLFCPTKLQDGSWCPWRPAAA